MNNETAKLEIYLIENIDYIVTEIKSYDIYSTLYDSATVAFSELTGISI